VDKNAEVSFVMKTSLESSYFEINWIEYLKLIEQIAFKELNLHKLFVYAFDLRPHLYKALERSDYFFDARLKDHCFIQGVYKDVVIYSKCSKE
jgi:RimJ/RimL family protein N-acetyltransferase